MLLFYSDDSFVYPISSIHSNPCLTTDKLKTLIQSALERCLGMRKKTKPRKTFNPNYSVKKWKTEVSLFLQKQELMIVKLAKENSKLKRRNQTLR